MRDRRDTLRAAHDHALTLWERMHDRAGLPDVDEPRELHRWLQRQIYARASNDGKVSMRIALAGLLEHVGDPLQRAEAEGYLSHILGDTPEPRRYAGPGDVVLSAAEAAELHELLQDVKINLTIGGARDDDRDRHYKPDTGSGGRVAARARLAK